MTDGPDPTKEGAGVDVPGGRFPTWMGQLATARARTARLREVHSADTLSDERASKAIEELQLAYEELTVAEDEIRRQYDELSTAHGIIEAERVRYRDLFQQAPVPYVVTDPSGIIRDANIAAGRLIKWPLELLPGKPLTDFTHETSRRRVRDLLVRLADAQADVIVRIKLVTRRKSVVRVEATASVTRGWTGDVQEVRWLLVDQRPRRRRDRARIERAATLEALVAERTSDLERSQRLKERLVATVSHELRTPLAAIAGFTELLSLGVRGPLSEAQRADIERIHRAYEHMARVVDDLLSFSKISAGQLPLDIQDAALRDQLRVVTEMITHQAGERGVTLTVAEPAETMVVRADPERFRQIVLNLVGNAVKFTPPGGSVTVRCTTTEHEAILEVRDDGRGIPHENHESIFEPFVRLPRDRLTPGTGLGLAISREMARAMGGDLTVTGDVDVGSCFALRLPLAT